MQIVHTNPILITFCSILYYKNLRNHVNNYKLERKHVQDYYNLDENDSIIMSRFTGKSSQVKMNTNHIAKKIYNKFIVNKWHVILFIHKNKSLIRFRSHNINRNKKID